MTLRKTITATVALFGLAALQAHADDEILMQIPAEQEQAVPAPKPAYPPMVFVSMISEEKLVEKIRAVPHFADLDKDALGSPIVLRVRYFQRMTAGGTAAGLTSAVLSGSTLGLIPLVTNNDLVVVYEFNVHGTPIASFEYVENFTEAQSLYSAGEGGLKGSALEWAEGTVDQFLADVDGNPAIQEIIDEYQYYVSDDE